MGRNRLRCAMQGCAGSGDYAVFIGLAPKKDTPRAERDIRALDFSVCESCFLGEVRAMERHPDSYGASLPAWWWSKVVEQVVSEGKPVPVREYTKLYFFHTTQGD